MGNPLGIERIRIIFWYAQFHIRIFSVRMATESCNFRCPYCYENHTSIFIRPEILKTIQRYIVDQVPHYKKVILAWFGGEPTLCKNMYRMFALLG